MPCWISDKHHHTYLLSCCGCFQKKRSNKEKGFVLRLIFCEKKIYKTTLLVLAFVSAHLDVSVMLMWFKMYKNILSLTVKTSKLSIIIQQMLLDFFYFAVRNGFFMMIHSHTPTVLTKNTLDNPYIRVLLDFFWAKSCVLMG